MAKRVYRNPFIYHLTTSYTFVELDIEIDPSDPYAKSIAVFRAFTKRVITALFRSAYWIRKLHQIYDDLPTAENEDAYREYRAWVKEATLKHPQRRTAQQHMWLRIVYMMTNESLRSVQSMVNQAIASMEEWEAEAYDIDNLRDDPDQEALYFFEHAGAGHVVELDTLGLGTSCIICTEDFDDDQHRPGRTSCGHFQCKTCFDKALDADSTKFICPFCRACLVCSRNGCVDHLVEQELYFPSPLPWLLERGHVLCNGPLWCHCSQSLFGLSPKRYWELREKTRKCRSRLTRIEEMIEDEVDIDHVIYLRNAWQQVWDQFELTAGNVKQRHLQDNTRGEE